MDVGRQRGIMARVKIFKYEKSLLTGQNYIHRVLNLE